MTSLGLRVTIKAIRCFPALNFDAAVCLSMFFDFV